MIVGIVGAGTMGAGIARVALGAGDRVRLHDVDPASGARVRADLERRYAETRPDVLARLAVVDDVAATAAEADVVIEAVPEDLALKRRVITVLDEAAPHTAILATNTSALSVGAIAAAAGRPERVLGLHFFNPPTAMRLVEVVAPPGVDPDVVRRAEGVVTGWQKVPVVCRDTPGFIVNRVNRPFTVEALRILESGLADVAAIDRAIRSAGFPMGPFELIDLVGLDVNLAATRALFAAFDDAPRFRPSPIQERLVAAGQLGRKTGRGFHAYERDGRAIEPAREEPMLGEAAIVERVVLAIVNEAFRALDEGVAEPATIDLALRLGAGHPIGPFERVEALGGPVAVASSLERLAREVDPRFTPAPALVAARDEVAAAG